MNARVTINISVNGRSQTVTVEPRHTLADVLRHDLGLSGTHVGCEHGVCGACTVLVDGLPVRSCLMFAVQAEGRSISTVESLGSPDELDELQRAFSAEHGLQCGFCTPGFLMLLTAFLAENHAPSDEEIREAVASNLCRCTGYQGIVRAACSVRDARLKGADTSDSVPS
jgi:carbon-monoxide dehydrogenase small subunit